MDKFSRTLGFCIGMCLINKLSVIFLVFIASFFLKNFNSYAYTLNFVGSLISLMILNNLLSFYDDKLLSKDILKKVEIKKILYIVLFGVGFSICMSILVGILTELISSYMNATNQVESINNSWIDLLVIIVLGPVYEEILYRRVIFEYLKNNYNIVLAVILQALVFGVEHGTLVQGIYTFILGIPLALVYMYSKSLLGSIVLHIVFNLMGNILPYLAAIGPIVEITLIISAIVCLILSTYKMTVKEKKIILKNNIY